MRNLSRAVLAAACLGLLAAAPAAAQNSAVERGRYLVESIGGCGNCHTPKGPTGQDLPGRQLAGGQAFEEPNLFRAVAPNITPDPATGIGRWTDAQIARAIREGVRPDGRVLGPPMPFEFYRDISDADVTAMVAYLRTVPAVANRVEASRYNFPLPPAWGPPVTTVAAPADNPVARGAYLAGPLGHCLECHTPRGPDMQLQRNELGAGGLQIHGPWGIAVTRNITSSREHGIGGWTDAQIVTAVTTGMAPEGRRLGPPMGYGYYARMTPADLGDLVAYLRTLPPRP